MKKHIAFMISCIMLAVCFSFPAFATTPTGRRREASFDYGDVSLHVSVDAGASVTYNNDVCHYDHRFTVTLTNKTNNFQVADQNILGFKLYTGRNDYFDNTFVGSSGTTQTNASWGADVTSYSDNMTVPDIKFYTSAASGWEGSVYIKFNDSDLLVLNPNETRTYNFTIDFIASQTTGAMPINGNYVYGYFTYLSNSSISIFNKPNNFTSNSIDQFIQNDSLPNSAIAWLIAAYEQGIIDQQKYDEIIQSLVFDSIPNYSINYNSVNGFVLNHAEFQYPVTVPNGTGIYFTRNIYSPYLVEFDKDAYPSLDSVLSGSVYCVPVDFIISVANRLGNSCYWNNFYMRFQYRYPFTSTNNLLGGVPSFDLPEDYYCTNFHNSQIDLHSNNVSNNNLYFPSGVSVFRFRINYYFYTTDTNFSVTPSTFDKTTFYINSSSGNGFYKDDTTLYSNKWSLGKIIDLLTGDKNKNDQISDDSGNVSDTESQIHQQEQQWYSDNEAAIEATGLSNFEFSSGELDGLTQLRLQFAQVWGALGDWTLVYIFVLSLSLATFILRHRPTTKAQQRMADSSKYRQDVRNRWAMQDARSSNNSNGFSDEIWRRAGYR